MVVGGLNGSILGFVGQNFGAKKYDRINKGYNTAVGIGIIYALLVSIVFTILRIPIALVLIGKLGINGVWFVISISSILKGITAYLIYKLKIWKVYKNVRCDSVTEL